MQLSRFTSHAASSSLAAAVRTRTTGEARPQDDDPIQLPESYLRAIERLEAMPENQSGTDKAWVERAIAGWRDHYARAVRIR